MFSIVFLQMTRCLSFKRKQKLLDRNSTNFCNHMQALHHHSYPISPYKYFSNRGCGPFNPWISPKLLFEFHAFQTSLETCIDQVSLLSLCVINISFATASFLSILSDLLSYLLLKILNIQFFLRTYALIQTILSLLFSSTNYSRDLSPTPQFTQT